MTKPVAVKRKPGPPKGMRFGGRQLGTKNRATIERELIAAKAVIGAAARGFAKDVLERQIAELERFKRFAETALVIHQPRAPDQLEKDQQA